MLIAFPSLICGVILSQIPDILVSSDVVSKMESLLSLRYRLFVGTHVPNIIVTFGKDDANSTSREGIIGELQDTCKALDETIRSSTEKKIRLESLVKALYEEDADGNLEGDDEKGNEDEGNVVIGGDKYEETNVNTDI